VPVPEKNLTSLQGGHGFQSGKRIRSLLHAGHASHHVTYWIERRDRFGWDTPEYVCRAMVSSAAHPAPDIDVEIWNQSLIHCSWGPERIFLRISSIENPAEHIRLYKGRLASGAANHSY